MAAAAAAAGAAAGPARDKAAAAVWDEIALRGALSAARAISDHVARAGALGEISRHLPEPEREVVFREALAAARAISDEAARDSALGVLSYYLPEMLKDEWRSARLPEIQSKPEFFITRIIGNEYQPDLAILTLPTWPSPEAIQDIDKLREEVICSDDFEIDRDRIKLFHFGPDACFTALHEAIVDAGFREKLLWEPEHSKNYAREIFLFQFVPVMNSPVSGSTLAQMVTAAGGGAAFLAEFPNPDAGHVMIYFLLIGGTRIVLGAADGISIALKQGLAHVLLKWMGVPVAVASPRKRGKATSPSEAGPPHDLQKS